MKGLEPALSQPGVICGGDGANGVLKEAQLVRKGCVVSGENEGTHDDIRVTIDVFRDAVVYNVGALEKRRRVERREEGIVNENDGF